MPESEFPRESRLLNARDYSPVFQQPDARVSNPQLLVLAKTKAQGGSRLGLVIAKKHIRLAVQRNRIKRIIRESFRARKAEFGTIDMVVLARPKLDERSSREIRELADALFDELLRKIT